MLMVFQGEKSTPAWLGFNLGFICHLKHLNEGIPSTYHPLLNNSATPHTIPHFRKAGWSKAGLLAAGEQLLDPISQPIKTGHCLLKGECEQSYLLANDIQTLMRWKDKVQ